MLIDGITLTSTATFAGVDLEKTLNQPGDLVVFTGTSRWYPNDDITIIGVRASVNTAPVGADLLIDVLKNGVSIGTITVAAGTNLSSFIVPSSVSILSSDYITIDITQVGSSTAGSDMVVQFNYETV